MKTTTTTREYDDEGRMVRETIVEQDMPCTCYSTAYGYCPMHGYRGYRPNVWISGTPTSAGGTFTVNTSGMTSPADVAKAVARAHTVHARV